MPVRVAGVCSVLVGCVVAVFLVAVQVCNVPHGWPLTAVRAGVVGVWQWREGPQLRLRKVDGGLNAGGVSGAEGVEGVGGTSTRSGSRIGPANCTAVDSDTRRAEVFLGDGGMDAGGVSEVEGVGSTGVGPSTGTDADTYRVDVFLASILDDGDMRDVRVDSKGGDEEAERYQKIG
jgi:hypothetical protein